MITVVIVQAQWSQATPWLMNKGGAIKKEHSVSFNVSFLLMILNITYVKKHNSNTY